MLLLRKYHPLLTAVLLLFYSGSIAQPVSQTFTSSGTYVVPAGYFAVIGIEAYGAGGGGGANTSGGKGGGGGGAYAYTFTSLFPGSYAVTVGTGGTPGNQGGNSSFTTIVTANGGKSTTDGNAGLGGAATTGFGIISYKGGNGGTAPNRPGGGGGGSAYSFLNGSNGGNGGPDGGAGGTGATGGYSGNGGNGGSGNNGAGNNATGVGNGGGGKAGPGNSSISGTGSNGLVIVTVYMFLAAKIEYFNIETGNNYNTLNWRASCGLAQVVFTVERSVNGNSDFSPIHTFTASKERCLQPFTFTDYNTLSGTLFYRIKITGVDGTATYSSIIKTAGSSLQTGTVTAFSSAAGTTQINAMLPQKAKSIIRITDINGKLVWTHTGILQKGTSIINANTATLPKGIYIVTVLPEAGSLMAVKFMLH